MTTLERVELAVRRASTDWPEPLKVYMEQLADELMKAGWAEKGIVADNVDYRPGMTS